MRFIIQRVKKASVIIEDSPELDSSIDQGFLVLIGISQDDIEEFFEKGNRDIANKMIHKLVNMRIFEDENGKTNLDLNAVNGNLMLVSQFTLYADCKHGNRPSFTQAGEPKRAELLYNYIVEKCREILDDENRIKTGVFGAYMKIDLLNDGPFTIILDSKEIM